MPRYSFLQCVLDTQKHSVNVQGIPVEVQPLVFDLLLYFVRNPGRVLSKDELLSAVWDTTFVTDSVVARAVMKLRRLIQDSSGPESAIATVRGVGYRLDAPVLQLSDEASSDSFSGLPATQAAASTVK